MYCIKRAVRKQAIIPGQAATTTTEHQYRTFSRLTLLLGRDEDELAVDALHQARRLSKSQNGGCAICITTCIQPYKNITNKVYHVKNKTHVALHAEDELAEPLGSVCRPTQPRAPSVCFIDAGESQLQFILITYTSKYAVRHK